MKVNFIVGDHAQAVKKTAQNHIASIIKRKMTLKEAAGQ